MKLTWFWFRRAGLFCLVALAIAVIAGGSEARLPKQLRFKPIEFKTPKVDTLVFENGLHGYLIEDHEIPVVTIEILFRSAYPPEDKVGLPSVAGWAIRNGGSVRYPKATIDDELEFVGASIESRADNRTGRISANFLTKDMDLVLDILADLLVNPAFDPDKIELRKKTLIEGIRRKADDPRSLGRREFSKLIYRDHPAGREPTEKTITNITRQDVVDFHNNYVRPNNAVIGIAGDITKEEALARLNRAFADWQPGGTRPVFPEMAYELNPSVNYIYKDVNQAYIFAGHMAMNGSNPDRPIATIMNYILGGGSFTSWITQRIRSDEGLAYHASSRYSPAPWGYGVFVATCQTRTDAAMRALELLIEQIERMKTEGPTEQEVEDAKQALLNRQVFEYESPRRLVSRLIWYDLVGLPLDTLEKDFEVYQKTTVEDVRRVARKYLHPEALTILVVGDQSKFDRPLSDFGVVNEIEIGKEVETQ